VTPDVVVDIGNTRIKWGWVVPGHEALKVASLPHGDPTAWDAQLTDAPIRGPIRWAVASVNPCETDRFLEWIRTRRETAAVIDDPSSLPITIDVDEPAKVGIDRLLNAVAARARVPEGGPVVVIDVGSAVTVDLLDERNRFRGGAILPGPRLMAKSLHQYTAKLPDLPIDDVPNEDPPGRNTTDAIRVGIMAAIMGGCQLLVDEYAVLCERPLTVLMAGGAVGSLIDYDFAPDIKIGGPFPLTLEGIRLAAEALP
jgi:type III pantothenate kinase